MKYKSSMPISIPKNSLFFAPMEGITDPHYRNMIFNHYPEWDYMACDFLRIPSVGHYPDKHIVKHFGLLAYQQAEQREKTIYQILTSEMALTKEHVLRLKELGFNWIDLNLGCPSKTVCKNKGGSFLLSELSILRMIIKTIRQNFTGTFTAKIRVGYQDDTKFENILHLLEEEGVDAITIHARTRDQLYKGVANWDYVKQAVQLVRIPIIGNGDIWTLEDIDRYFDYTQAHSIMLARGALKTPWIARMYKSGLRQESLEERLVNIQNYFKLFYQEIEKEDLNELGKIRRLKSVSRNIFDPLPSGETVKKKFLLSKSKDEMFDVLQNLKY